MSCKRLILTFTLAYTLAMPAIYIYAQSSNEYNSDISSTYSRYGLGVLSKRYNGFNAGMAGAGLALSTGNRINIANPASLSSVDPLTFILDAGMEFSHSSMTFNGNKISHNGARLQYVNMAFQLANRVGMSVGYNPFSSIGYDYTLSKHVGWNANTGQQIRTSNVFFGTGGLHQLYVGVGYAPIKRLSFGVNAGYLWGEYNHCVNQTFTEGNATASSYNAIITQYLSTISTYNIEFGMQYTQPVSKDCELGLGATVGVGHIIHNDAEYYRYTTEKEKTPTALSNAFQLPMTYAVGLAYTHKTQWKVAADFGYEQWGKCKMPGLDDNNVYTSEVGRLKDCVYAKVGLEYCPNALSRKYVNRLCYRIGAFYNTSYMKINNENGPDEYGITAGVSLPITNSYNNRSVVNIGFVWSHLEPSSIRMISENQISIRLGLTFNEQWFKKWRIR